MMEKSIMGTRSSRLLPDMTLGVTSEYWFPPPTRLANNIQYYTNNSVGAVKTNRLFQTPIVMLCVYISVQTCVWYILVHVYKVCRLVPAPICRRQRTLGVLIYCFPNFFNLRYLTESEAGIIARKSLYCLPNPLQCQGFRSAWPHPTFYLDDGYLNLGPHGWESSTLTQ